MSLKFNWPLVISTGDPKIGFYFTADWQLKPQSFFRNFRNPYGHLPFSIFSRKKTSNCVDFSIKNHCYVTWFSSKISREKMEILTKMEIVHKISISFTLFSPNDGRKMSHLFSSLGIRISRSFLPSQRVNKLTKQISVHFSDISLLPPLKLFSPPIGETFELLL